MNTAMNVIKTQRVACVMPPYYRLIESKNNRLTPAMHYVAECLHRRGHQVTLINGDYAKGSYADRVSMMENSWLLQDERIDQHTAYTELIATIKAFRPDYVFISAGDVLLPTVELSNPDSCIITAERIKREISPRIVCVGYGHLLKHVSRDKLKALDVVITCEAEGLLDDIIVAGKRGVFDDCWQENLDDLPILTDDYLHYPVDSNDWDYIMSRRGCEKKCAFCLQPTLRAGRVAKMSAQRFVDEIKYRIERFNIYDFYFSDLVFLHENSSRSQAVIDLLQQIKLQYPDFSWRAEYRVDMINSLEFLKQLKLAGCRHIKFGVEMMNDDMLKTVNKGTTTAQVKRAFALTKQAGISRTAYILLGCPGFSDDDYKKMWYDVKDLKADSYVINISIPYMGTELYYCMADQLKKHRFYESGEEGYIHVSKKMQHFWQISDETMQMYFQLEGRKDDLQHREYQRKIVDQTTYLQEGVVRYKAMQAVMQNQ